jgi:hypothetical protein
MTPQNNTPVRYELDTTTGHGDRSTEQHLVLDATDTWAAVCPDDPAAALVALVNENQALREALAPFAKFACDPPCGCHNCIILAALHPKGTIDE